MAYRAEIEIAVKGANQLSSFQGKLDAAALAVDNLNKFLKNFSDNASGISRSISNLSDQLRQSARAFNDVALGTEEARTAAVNYLEATRNLNAGLRERAALLAEVAENERKAKLASAGIRERTQYPGPIGPGPVSSTALSSPLPARSRFFGGTQYPGPIGPGPVSQTALFSRLPPSSPLLSGQASDIVGLNQRNLDIKRDERVLEQALLKLKERRADAVFEELKSTTSLVNGVKDIERVLQRQKGLTQFSEPLPTPGGLRTEQILASRAAKRTESLAIEQRLQRVAASTVTQYNLQLGILRQMAAVGERIGQATQQELVNQRRLNRILRVRKGRELQRSRRAATSNALIGGAFPLLFGQGIGAAAGGAIGGGAGGLLGGQFGFGLSLVGTSLGQAVDTFVQNVRKVSDSLRSPTETLQALEEVGFSVSDSVKLTVEELLEANKIYEAQAVALQEVTDKLGPKSVELLNAFSEESKKLNSEYERLAASITSAVLPALVGLTALLNDFSSILRSVEVPQQLQDFLLRLGAAGAGGVVPGLAQAQTVFGAVTTRGRRAAEEAGQPGLTPQLKALESEAADKAVEQERAQERSVAVLESQYNVLLAGKSVLDERVYLEKQALIQQQYYKEISEEISKGLDTEMPKLRRLIALEQLRNQRIDDRKRLQEAAARKAAKAAREAERAAALLERQQVQGFNLDLQGLRVNQATVAAETGPIAALNRQILDLTEKKTILENIAKLTIEDTELLNKQLKLIAERISLEQTVTEQKLKQLKLNTEAGLVDELNRDKRSLKDAQLETEAARAALTTPFDPVAQQSNELILSQLRESIQKTRELQDRREALANAVKKASNEEKAERKLVLKQFDESAAKIQQELALRQELERALLKQNQLIEKYGFLANELSTAMTSAVQAVVTGTGTVEEAFSTMFANIGKAFIDMATQMLAQKLFMTVLGALGGGGGGGLSGGLGGLPGTSNVPFIGSMPFTGFADGGTVMPGNTYMVGERGPELLKLNDNGSGQVINNNQLSSAMNRYRRNGSGEQAANSGASSDYAAAGSDVATLDKPIDVRYSVERINSVDYVTANQFQAGLKQAAEQGERRAIQKLQMSPGTRRRLGI